MDKMVTTGEHDSPYQAVFGDVSKIIDAARESASRSVNAAMTAAYWLTGRCIVEFEQSGEDRAKYGAALIERLAEDLTRRFGRGFSRQNVQNMRLFYLSYPPEQIRQTLSSKSALPPGQQIRQTQSGESETAPTEVGLEDLLAAFPLSWSAYVRLLSVRNESAREFYETEALRGGWSIRQLARQINSQFYERTALSKNKAAMLTGGQAERPEDIVLPNQQIKDPFVLEFLDLKDEYSESDLEEALIQHLETFLLELGDDFCFMGRQRRLRVGSQWYRVDLLFFHRRLRCLVIIDLKIGTFTHADAGQMHFYLNYAREHWVREGENPPVGLILCSEKDADVHSHARRQVSHAPHPYRGSRLLGVHQTNQVCSPRTVGRSHRQGITGRNELRNPVHRPETGAPTRPRADRNDSGHVPNLRRNHLGSPSRRHPGPGPRQPDTDHRLQRRKQHGCGGGHRVRRESSQFTGRSTHNHPGQPASSFSPPTPRTLHRYDPAPLDPGRRNPPRTHAGCHQPSHIADRHPGTLAPTDSDRQYELRPTPAPLHTRVRMPMPQGGIGHADAAINAAALMLADALPPEYPPTTSLIHFYVPDCDAVYAQAIAAGATSIAEPADQAYGDRLARITDLCNNQ